MSNLQNIFFYFTRNGLCYLSVVLKLSFKFIRVFINKNIKKNLNNLFNLIHFFIKMFY